jgi:hypothetical protein
VKWLLAGREISVILKEFKRFPYRNQHFRSFPGFHRHDEGTYKQTFSQPALFIIKMLGCC